MSPRPTNPRAARAAGIAFIVSGLAFLVIGLSDGQASFRVLGPALAVIGIALLAQGRRRS